MRQGCLGLFDCFSPSDPDEQIPISANSRMEDSKRLYDSISELDVPSDLKEKEEAEKPPMGIIRKVLFALSLNGPVGFVVVLLWAIPCRLPLCRVEHGWDYEMSAMLTSNMEMVKIPDRSNAVVFCLADQYGGHLSSLNTSGREMLWNRTLSESFCRHVFCEFGRPLQIDQRRICIVTGYNFIGAVDVANGEMVWQQNHTHPSGEVVHQVALSSSEGFPHLLGISENYIYSVNANNGTIVSMAKLPCSSELNAKIAGPWIVGNDTLWALMCMSGDIVAVYTFEEGDVLSPAEDGNPRDDVGFDLKFSRESWSGSIDLASDVTSTLEFLAVAWADSVAMVTTRSLEKTWERRFEGDYLAVTSMVFGHFTDLKKMQIAVAVKDENNMTIHILDARSGSSMALSGLGEGSVYAMEKIPGTDGEIDTLLIESIQHKERNDESPTHSPEHTLRSYFTLRYNKKSVIHQAIATTNAYASTLNSISEGSAHILTASKTPDDGTSLQRIVVTTAVGPFCRADELTNTTIVLTTRSNLT